MSPYVQGMDHGLAMALAAGATEHRANSEGLLSDGTVTGLGDVRTTGTVATFDFSLVNSCEDGYAQEFSGMATLVSGRWRLS